MLKIKNLHAQSKNGQAILKGIHLEILPGQVHAVMGPNGSGKSTLAKVLAGHPEYKITGGEILYEVNFEYQNITSWPPEQRVKEGIFTAFQYPVEVPGVSNFELLKSAFNKLCEKQGAPAMKEPAFQALVESYSQQAGLPKDFLHRSVNENFSGGEKKRNEILQMMLLSPRLALLDETDSGLDVDSLARIARCLKTFMNKNKALVLITHYDRLFKYLKPHFVHIIQEGVIQKTGGPELAGSLEKKGFTGLSE